MGERRVKMEIIGLAMEMMLKEFRKEHGQDAFLEEGESITGVFNDGIVKISMGPEKDLSVEVLLGEPYKFDFTLGLQARMGEEVAND